MRHFVFSCAIFYAVQASAQDLHFSQFYTAPLYLNPSLAANMECSMRAGTSFRGQWASVTTPYKNRIAFVEHKLFFDELGDDWAGVGGAFYNNVAGDGHLNLTRGMLMGSFHKGLMAQNVLFVSVGAGLGLANKSIDFSGLTFDTQWDGYTYNTALPHDEPYRKQSVFYPDLNAGINVTYTPVPQYGDWPFAAYAGIAAHHINRPKDSFYDQVNKIGMKTMVHAGCVMMVKGIVFQPGCFFAVQKEAKELTLGSNAVFRYKDTDLFIGPWWRAGRDLVVAAGVESDRLTIMVSYDVNISSLALASGHEGGYEISITKSLRCNTRRAAPSGFNFFQYPNFRITDEAIKYQN